MTTYGLSAQDIEDNLKPLGTRLVMIYCKNCLSTFLTILSPPPAPSLREETENREPLTLLSIPKWQASFSHGEGGEDIRAYLTCMFS